VKDVVEAIIEIPNGSKNKFEIKDGKIKLDRVLYSSMSYPAEYGFIDNTLAKDGDPLDILVIGSEPSYPGCIIPARVIGALKMLDNGKEDYKIISVVAVDPRYNEVNALNDLSSFILDEIKNFFENYKTLQNIPVKVLDYYGKEDAFKVIESSKQRYNDLRKK
jgi:inorganic pyrophosphatase